jgi:sarcosine oxidase
VEERYDAIVVGLGGMGSATAIHLARRGLRVLGLERYDVLHPFGSSHGLNRIIRLAYSEHPAYVPLLLRAYELWRELQRIDRRQLLWITGSLEGGIPDGGLFKGALHSSQLHALDHEVLSGGEANRRWPAYRLSETHRLVYQPEGGFLASEECILAHVRQALAGGPTG